MKQLFQQYNAYEEEPADELVLEKNAITIDIAQAIRLIQKNDRGRQGRQRIMLILKKFLTSVKESEIKRKRREGVAVPEQTKDMQELESCIHLQKRMRAILARKYIEKLRMEEMEFLGMTRKKKTHEEERNDPIKKMELIRQERKLIQENNWKRYKDA